MENEAPETPENTLLPQEESWNFQYLPFKNQVQPLLVLLLVGFIFYFNTFNNEYALDDGIIIHQNTYVLKGVQGIGDILTKDTYYSFYKRMNATDQLQGGRYRPLPIMTYAIEQELIGAKRTGSYNGCFDLNRNGVFDDGEVTFTNNGNELECGYEYNTTADLHHDGVSRSQECLNCWDLNRNLNNDSEEDLNADGIFNEVDCQVYGAGLRHLVNVGLYLLAALCVYLLFSRYLLKQYPDAAFLAALIYLIHPVHSEVVANVKGRDEILSLLFIALTFIFLFRYIKQTNAANLAGGLISFFFALMSKEHAVLLFLLTPLLIYVFTAEKTRWLLLLAPLSVFVSFAAFLVKYNMHSSSLVFTKEVVYALGFLLFLIFSFTYSVLVIKRHGTEAFYTGLLGVAMLYLTLRLNATTFGPGVEDSEILNNPFLLATGAEQLATKLVVLFTYLKLSIFPHPLVSDYSYAMYAYPDFTDWRAITAIVLYAMLLMAGIRLTIKKHVLGFALLTYLIFILAVSNLFFHTGLMMIETLLFQATLGTALALGWMLDAITRRLLEKGSVSKIIPMGGLLAVLLLCGFVTIQRNRDWKNDVTLFLKDVKNAPNSVLVLGNAGARWIDLADTREITGIDLPGMEHKAYNDYNGALQISDEEVKAAGFKNKREAAVRKGIDYLQRAVELHPKYVNGFLNLGLAYYKLKNDTLTILNWKVAERLYPNNPYLANYYAVYCSNLKSQGTDCFNYHDFKNAVFYYNLWTIVTPGDWEAWYSLGGAYFNTGDKQRAAECFKKVLKLKPDNKQAQDLLRMC